MLHTPEVFVRRLRRFLNRSKWLIRLLRLPSVSEAEQRRGLILIQIDALSRREFEAALKKKRMPFLRGLLEKQGYHLRTHYSGFPCSTPGVQAELFYGVKAGVPSFSFFDAQTQRVFTLFNPNDAEVIQSRLEQRGAGLFKGGSCYSNIFTGGAEEPHFCIADLHVPQIFGKWKTFSFMMAVLLHVYSLLRAGILLLIETILAVTDFFRGVIKGRDFLKELKFVPSRVAICILLREIIVIGAKLDITRGLPIVHLNLMGYHEQSHRRGATSRFAHWTLKGIDDAIKRIWVHAHRVDKQYDVWIYSDHGQVDTVPYETAHGETLTETITWALDMRHDGTGQPHRWGRPGFLNRSGWHLQRFVQSMSEKKNASDAIRVTSLGPYAQVYLDEKHRKDKTAAAAAVLATGKIPLILIPETNGGNRTVRVLTEGGEYQLPDEGNSFFFENDFIPNEAVEDLIRSCHHADAGDIIVCGYSGPHSPYYTFVKENGSHGGLSEFEYSGFFLGPKQLAVETETDYVRPTDIRRAALHLLNRSDSQETLAAPYRHQTRTDFRLMTYNVHSCVGMDGRRSVLRIARVIEQFDPDIVALQELDVGRRRSASADQAQLIADILKMDHFFFPAIALEEEQYGDAILSRFPMRLVQSDILPGHPQWSGGEPRGALWVQIEIGRRRLNLLNTHLGLTGPERTRQVQSLLSGHWTGHAACGGATVLCGDFNFSPRSPLYRQCRKRFRAAAPASPPTGTYCGRYPFIRLDHIFYSDVLILQDCQTGDTDLARAASDHRPLIAVFAFDPEEGPSPEGLRSI